jgi:hypothetical protein
MSTTSKLFSSQIKNRNFLAPTGFKFSLNRAPKVAFFANAANIPAITLGTTYQPNYLVDNKIPGEKIDFEDFTLNFLVDENLENYVEIQNWIRGLWFPESLNEIYKLQSQKIINDNSTKQMNIYSDGSLIVLNSSLNNQFEVVFNDMFPYYLSGLEFDATNTDIEYFTAQVSFKYTYYKLYDRKGKQL